MSVSAYKLVLLIFVCPLTSQQSLPAKAVNAERIKLLKDALSWMTFKKNGQLASDQDLEPFFGVLKDKYLNSKYYRTIIIAFSHGVLPKLTLKENAPCDASYTLEYRDSHNNSVTDGQLKKFILESYDKRGDGSRQFCDYREGLVCNQNTSKCECPPGSKMERVSQGSAEIRCLVQENEVCNLIDLDHDPNSKYEALKKYLPEMVFNLEKPLSCKMGTQCRFKPNDQITPRCYLVNNGPWDKGRWDIDFGEECTLGLYGDTGQCRVEPKSTPASPNLPSTFNGYTCFNFGPRSQPKSPLSGFCTRDLGSYSITSFSRTGVDIGLYWELQMIAFVTPATTSIRGRHLFDFYFEYYDKFNGPFSTVFTPSAMALSAGDRCNIEKTEKLLKLWKFLYSLEGIPPSGKDYVATEAELKNKFKEAEELTVDLNKKMCRYRSDLSRNLGTKHALKCVRHSTDGAGNDGRCEVIPENEDVTLQWATSLFEYQNHVGRTSSALRYEEDDYRRDIYEPELECDPRLGHPPGSEGAPPSTNTDVLEGGYCPPDRVCHEDYSDFWGIYVKDCKLKDSKPRVWRNCQNLDENRKYDSCEEQHLDQLFEEELERVSSYGGLQRGDACKYDFEEKLRDWVEYGGRFRSENKYKRLIEVSNLKNGMGGIRLCDRTKLLECSQSGTCECLENTQSREVELEGGMKLYSDYCYVASGNCGKDFRLHGIFDKSSQMEKNAIDRHYNVKEGQPEWTFSCRETNWCVFAETEGVRVTCTTDNTGNTGYNESEPVTITTTTTTTTTTGSSNIDSTDTDKSNVKCEDNDCGWQEAGEAQNEMHVIFKMIILINILN